MLTDVPDSERQSSTPQHLALTHRVSPRISQCALTYLERRPIDHHLAAAQHEAYNACLRRHGLEVIELSVNLDLPDSVFVEDAAVVVDETAVMATMGVDSRRGEVAGVEAELAKWRLIVRIDPKARLEGGDVLRMGRRLFIGLTSRTDAAGAASLTAILEPFGYRVSRVPLKKALHLKSAVSALDEETLIINPWAVDAEFFAGFRLVEAPVEEPEAANVLRLGRVICLHAGFLRTIDLLTFLGYEVDAVDISELLKAEAGMTCSSIIFRRPTLCHKPSNTVFPL